MSPPRKSYALKDGYAWSPLSSYPRNHACFCGSEKKFKSCHLGKTLPICKADQLEKLREVVKHAKAGRKVLLRIVTPKEKKDE